MGKQRMNGHKKQTRSSTADNLKKREHNFASSAQAWARDKLVTAGSTQDMT
jgi:hypothetical protein